VGQGSPEGAQSGHGAQHVAESGERPEDHDAARPDAVEHAVRPAVDVLIPTADRGHALAVTLTSLAAQTHRPLRVVVSDQSAGQDALARCGELQAVLRVLPLRGIPVEVLRHVPRRGLAEQRQFLLDQAAAPAVLFLDDDVIVEPDLVERLLRALTRQRIGFVGSAVLGLSHLDDVRPHEQGIEFWDGPVEPEVVRPGGEAWARARLHNAANLHHIAQRLGTSREADRLYRVAWVGGCVLYDRAALEEAGGFGFWRDLPAAHAGEDVLAQLRVMARSGGAGLLPSGAYHQELPTTVEDRRVDAPWAL
jgi:GT2 family glycosyltransferase